METINKEIPDKLKRFFDEMKRYIKTPIYFYGSIQRADYFMNSSDIDISIFAINIESMVAKLKHFLLSENIREKKIMWRVKSGLILKGKKLVYKNREHSLRIEINIYNEKDKGIVLSENRRKIPFYTSCMLIILKVFYYKLNFIDRDLFRNIKALLLGESKNNVINY